MLRRNVLGSRQRLGRRGTITCTDNAGNSNSAASSPFKYDDTGPQINGSSLGRAPDANGWYNHPVAVNFTATDNLSGVAGCSAVTYSGPDGGSASVPGSCTDVAGNPATGGATIKYDSTGPSVGGSPDRVLTRTVGTHRPVDRLPFGGADNALRPRSLLRAAARTLGPDGMGSAAGSCSDNAGNTGSGAVQIPYDATAPTVKELVTARPVDAAGWFNHPVGVTFTGDDAGSGVESCSSLTYGGPDSGTAQVSGTCRDKAGHESAAKAFRLKYDATPPSLSTVIAQVGNKFALLKWKISQDVSSVRVVRVPGRAGETETVVYAGKSDFYKDTGIDNRTQYEYRVSAADEAANATPEQKATAVPLPPLYNPAQGARVRSPIVFEWLAVEKATYYNVQVWCRGRKMLTAWPKTSRLVVPRHGKFAGRAYTLPRASCRWLCLARLRQARRAPLRQAGGAEHVRPDALASHGRGLSQPRRQREESEDAERGERQVDRGVGGGARRSAAERGPRRGAGRPREVDQREPVRVVEPDRLGAVGEHRHRRRPEAAERARREHDRRSERPARVDPRKDGRCRR